MFNRDDLTARARIREEALRLFAQHGPDAVTVRQVAAAAGVSAGLVVHHFASKEGLRVAVDEQVAAVFDGLFAEFPGEGATRLLAEGAGRSIAELVVRSLPPDSPIPAYLRRLLLSGDAAGTGLFRRWWEASQRMAEVMTEAGLLRAGRDPEMRTAILMVNDLAVLLLRDQLEAVLHVDPLSVEGMARWAEEVPAVYRGGMLGADPEREPAPEGQAEQTPEES